jgi:hypothetical protein
VIREPTILLTRPRVSHQSSARFFYLVDAIAKGHEPTQTQLAALESSYGSTGEFLATCPEFEGLLLQVHAHGSRQLGTLVRPMDESREGFDIDLVARLHEFALRKYGGDNGPTLLLNHLYIALERYARAHSLRIFRWERCVTLEYAGGMCADIAPVADDPLISVPFGDTHGRVPDRKLQLYEPSNPRGYVKFFDRAAAISPVFTGAVSFSEALEAMAKAEITPLPSVQEVFERLLCRLIQLLKLHRNVAFGGTSNDQDVSPTSIFITTLAATAYAAQARLPHDSPMDLLLDIVETLPDHFQRIPQEDGSQRWHLSNPSAPHDNLAVGMNTPQRQLAFDWWHQRLGKQLTEILAAIDGHSGMDLLLSRVEAAFGKRAACAIQQDQSQWRSAKKELGRVALIPAVGVPVSAVAKQHNFFGGQ